MSQRKMFGHQEKCPICGEQFVSLAVEFQRTVQFQNSTLKLQVAVCSLDCAAEALVRIEGSRNAKKQDDKWK